MTRFGPAGASDSFKAQGYKHSFQAPAWLAQMGLTAFEYSSGHGVQLGAETARKIGSEAERHGIAVSIHAPYFINLAAEDDKLANSYRHLKDSAAAVRAMGGRRVIFHAGSKKEPDFMPRAMSALEHVLRLPELQGIILCPETMGRAAQIGTVEEVIALCRVADNLIPAIDFAHLHALRRIETSDDYRRVLDPMLGALGRERMQNFHAHFSHIEYTAAGEKRHRNFDEEGFGPDFAPLALLLREYGLTPTVICESRGHQAEDALTMKQIYEEAAA